jgi:outer membrane receptor for ferric coprogen and ferric-rhodotorulic acid
MFGRDQEVSIGVSRSERHFTAYSAFATSVAPIGDFNEWDGTGYPEHIWGERFLYEEQTDTQTALYASTRINWTEQFSTIIGGRLTDLEIDRKAAAYNDAQVIEHNGIFTPYLGVLYAFNDTYAAYASYTEIFSPQNERSQSGEVLNPISGNSYEIGLKAGFAEDQLLATVAVFKTLQDDLAAVDGTNTVSGSVDQAYKEAEGATSKGYEIELVGALTETWEVQLGWTKYEVEDAQGEKINTEQPRSIFKSYTRYQLPGALNKITVGGGINWESESYSTATNPVSGTPEKVQQEAFALVSLMAKYQITPEFSTQLNVDNLTDETYYTNIGTFGQIANGSPRTLSLSAKYNF